jgi:predicted AlkP superfamily phosphohydrolase/phosphomutase
VIGIDSADWALLDTLGTAGAIPNFVTFKEQATSGRMLSFRPLEKSPVLWASILTGVAPQHHGVGGFVSGEDQKPVRGSAWQAPALWDIAGAAELSTAIIGMWTTYPARDINGVMVSDYLPYGGHRELPLQGLVSPDSLVDIVVDLKVKPTDLTVADLGRFLDSADLAQCENEYPQPMKHLRTIHAADRSYLNVARWLASHEAYDIFFFYLRGPDMISHKFWPYFEPHKSPTELTAEEIALFGRIVPRYYEWVDEVIAEVQSWFPPETPTVILSDHGFHGPRHRRTGWTLGTEEHNPFGIFLVRSPYYEPGAWFDRMELLDIFPTLLALVGLPASEEMPGVVLSAGLTKLGQRTLPKLNQKRVASYQALTPVSVAEGEEDPEVDEAIREQLRSLGYIK